MQRIETGGQVDQTDQSIGNGYQWSSWDATLTNEVPLIGLDPNNNLRLGEAVVNPVRESTTIHLYPNANMVTQAFFVNPTPRTLAIKGINCILTTVGTVAGATASITHEATVNGTQQAPGTGKVIQTGTFGLSTTATAETLQAGVLASPYLRASRGISVTNANPGAGLIVLQPGDSLSIVFAGTLTTLVGLTITLYMTPGSQFHFVSYVAAPAASVQTLSLMTAMRPRTLLYGTLLVSTPETATGTLTLNVTKDASGTAPGAGTAIATALTLKGTANTPTAFVLGTAANLSFNATDSVAVLLAGSATPTAIAGVLVTLAFAGNMGEVQIDYNPQNSTVGTNEEFWIADRDYEVLDFSGKWSHVGGTSAVVGITADTGTQTPGAGTILQTDNSSTGFLTTGTINVPVFATLVALHSRFLRAGDRLGTLNGGTLGSLAGFQSSIRLRAM
jgi:hypothetical protein